MFWFILGIILFLAGISFGIVALYNDEKGVGIGCMVVGAILGILLVVLSCFTSIPTGHTGVVTTFGRVENITLDAGISTKAPWQSVIKMDNRVQKKTIPLACFSSDIQEVNVSYTINYQIDKNNAMNIYKSVGTSYYDTVIAPNVAESVKVVVAKYTAEELVGSRSELAIAIEEYLAKSLETYNIQVVSTAIEDMDFTDAFTSAVESKQVAAQKKLQSQIEQEQKTLEQEEAAKRSVIDANAKAEVAKIEANADLEVTKIQADAAEYAGQKEAAKNAAIAKNLTPELINYYYIQRWNGSLPESYVGSDNVSSIVGMK